MVGYGVSQLGEMGRSVASGGVASCPSFGLKGFSAKAEWNFEGGMEDLVKAP
jgi:hypothetical protein